MAKEADNKGMIKPGEFTGQKPTVDNATISKPLDREAHKSNQRGADGKIKTTTQQLKKLR
tara:strand:- start:5 stop:184 length:180 start_codon:yes stop_codon:yes gene_type:complete